MCKYLTLIFIIISFPLVSIAQDAGNYIPSDERSSFQARKKSVMDGNLLRATYHNYGQGGKVNPNEFPDEFMYEFPRNTGRQYMLFVMTFIGAEVDDQLTPEEDPFAIVDVANLKTSFAGDTWSLNPILGYAREDVDEIARSDRGPGSTLGNTWPNFWPDKMEDGGDGWAGSWNGYFGRDQFSADVEFYYKTGDDLYTRYSDSGRFRPDSTDASRGGLGIIMDTRIMAWSQTLINATHFNLFEIKNDGTTNYRKVAFGLWIADFVAGSPDGDEPEFDDLRSIAFLKDVNRELAPEYFDGPAGEMGLQFLETPGNSIDGIDNDGDSDFYNATSNIYNADNQDLFSNLVVENGGFYTQDSLINSVIPVFTPDHFQQRNLQPGDKIVRILDNGDRVIDEYPAGGGTVYSRGKTWELPASGITVQEDVVDESSPYFANNNDQLDNDFDGLIDENQPNHLLKATFINNAEQIIAVRYINYLNFEVNDTLKRGMIVPTRVIRDRISTDTDFRQSIEEYQNTLENVHDGSFNTYYYHIATTAPMIDEARDDYFDNDNDWNIASDDVGIEGSRDVPSAGANDNAPTSGAKTTFPGEPSIDKTDVSESDQLGVTRASIFGSGVLNTREDQTIWNRYMIPGPFERNQTTDSDIFIASSLFPLAPGQIERFAVSITAAQTFSSNSADDRAAVNENLRQSYTAYENDYQFAVAPEPPIVKAVAGDGRITLYWEDNSENSFDRYIDRITGNGNDFEGYKIYRATDDAFEDAFTITNALGNAQFNRPLAIYDKNDGIKGFHPVPVNGVQFNLGNDSGLRYSFVDDNVVNGKQYYYAVTAFDYGAASAGISPSESPIQISRNVDGSVTLGQNVITIRPSDTQAGYISPENPNPVLVSGSPGGTVTIDVIDPGALLPDRTYAVVFEDTLVTTSSSAFPELITQNFSLLDVTSNEVDTLISRSNYLNGEELPVTDGFRIQIQNVEKLDFDLDRTKWVYNHEQPPHVFDLAVQENRKISDYEIIIGESVGFGRSTAASVATTPGGTSMQSLPAIDTNFKIFNTYTGQEIKYAFFDNPGANQNAEPGELSASTGLTGKRTDIIIFIEEYRGEENQHTYRVQLSPVLQNGVAASINPQPLDTLKIFTTKPFSQNDRYEFIMSEEFLPSINNELAKQELIDIKVVPNPYIVTNPYEQRNNNINSQIQRELHFTHMPVPSTLRIFTVSGFLVREIEITEDDIRRVGGEFGGTYIWDMLTKDNLEISYGVYLYHVEAPGVGTKTGKFAVIK